MITSGRDKHKLFGMVALSLGFITKEQLQECLDVQQKFTIPLPLGAIMMARSHITENQLRDVLRVQAKALKGNYRPKTKTQRRKLLGEILIEQGHIDKQTLATALERQETLRNTGFSPRLGELLVYLGKITPDQLKGALAVQARASA